MNRPSATLVLAVAALLAALSSLVVTLQFLEVIPWGEDDFDFWGGKWVGVLLFGFVAVLALVVCYGWLTLKPWAFTITIFMALIGLSIPVSALIAGTKTLSTALLPIATNSAILILTLSKKVRQATKPGATPAMVQTVTGTRKDSKKKSPAVRPDDI